MSLLHRMARMRTISAYQRDPSWIARFVLRPDYEPVDMGSNQARLYDLGVRNYVSALAFLKQWYDNDQKDVTGVFVFGTRDMCWQLSWLLEILEGRYSDDIADSYSPDLYLNSRYGSKLYWDLFDIGN